MNKFKKSFTALLTAVLIVSSVFLAPTVEAKADGGMTEDISLYYEDRGFTWRSIPETIYVATRCRSISLYATCEDGQTDTLFAYIENIETGATDVLEFPADGSVTTYAREYEAGVYKIYFVGSAIVNKTAAVAVFTVVYW